MTEHGEGTSASPFLGCGTLLVGNFGKRFPIARLNISWTSAEAWDPSYPKFLPFLTLSQESNQYCDVKAFLAFSRSLSFFIFLGHFPWYFSYISNPSLVSSFQRTPSNTDTQLWHSPAEVTFCWAFGWSLSLAQASHHSIIIQRGKGSPFTCSTFTLILTTRPTSALPPEGGSLWEGSCHLIKEKARKSILGNWPLK